MASLTPSLSASGQPFKSIFPARLGHESLASSIPSPSESGQPLNSANP